MAIDKTLSVQKRIGKGKGANGRLRSQALVPGVYYTPKGENIVVQAPALPLEKIFENVGRTTVFNLEIQSPEGTETHPVLIWDVQRHPYKKQFLHIDYYGVDLDKEVKVDVPVEFVGTAKGVKLGGVLETYREYVHLGAKPMDMPKKITIDVSDMNIGDVIDIANLELPPNVRAAFDHNYAIVSVMAKSKEAEEEGAAGEEKAE